MKETRPIAVVAATELELQGIREVISKLPSDKHDIQFYVTGVGMVNTAMHLTELLSKREFSQVVNVGIAGSFDPAIVIGDVVQVSTDRIAWLGSEDQNGFLPAEELGLCPVDEIHFNATCIAAGLPKVNGITVNMAHGSTASIRRTTRLYSPQVESMEGAACFRVCAHFGVKAMQIRAISNRVEPRNRDAWDIPLALNNLTVALVSLLEALPHGD